MESFQLVPTATSEVGVQAQQMPPWSESCSKSLRTRALLQSFERQQNLPSLVQLWEDKVVDSEICCAPYQRVDLQNAGWNLNKMTPWARVSSERTPSSLSLLWFALRGTPHHSAHRSSPPQVSQHLVKTVQLLEYKELHRVRTTPPFSARILSLWSSWNATWLDLHQPSSVYQTIKLRSFEWVQVLLQLAKSSNPLGLIIATSNWCLALFGKVVAKICKYLMHWWITRFCLSTMSVLFSTI